MFDRSCLLIETAAYAISVYRMLKMTCLVNITSISYPAGTVYRMLKMTCLVNKKENQRFKSSVYRMLKMTCLVNTDEALKQISDVYRMLKMTCLVNTQTDPDATIRLSNAENDVFGKPIASGALHPVRLSNAENDVFGKHLQKFIDRVNRFIEC